MTINFEWFKDLYYTVQNIILDIFIALGPSLNYVFQVRKFHKTKSSKGFSVLICLANIISPTIKVFFWFSKQFKYTLLIQSILVIIMQLYLIELILKYKESHNIVMTESSELLPINSTRKEKIQKFINESLLDWSKTLDIKLIWRWNNSIEYYKCYFLIIFLLAIISLILGVDNEYYANITGSLSVTFDMICSLPQIFEIYKAKDQRNISKIMVFMWFCGNVIKIYYNHINNSPIQLIIGSYIQLFCNIVLIYLLFYYYIYEKKEPTNTITVAEEISFEDENENDHKEEVELVNYDKANNKV